MTVLPTESPADVFAGLPVMDYEHLDHPHDVHRVLREAREQSPLAIGPHGLEVLTYELVRSVLRDDRFAVPKGMTLPAQGITSGPVWDIAVKGLLSLDGAEHHRQRRLVSKAFTPKAAGRLRSTCAEVIGQLIEHGGSGRCDVVTDIARQYPIPVICALLGTPGSDWHRFSDWADDVFKIFEWNVEEDTAAIVGAWNELEDYLSGMVDARRDTLTDDLLSDLIRAEVDGDRLTHDELLTLAATLLMAGTDTTRNQLGGAVDVLCDHPDQWALLAKHPEIAPRAVEEVMRHSPVIFAAFRIALVDVEIAGVTIPAGTLVMANTASANRDAAVYERPDELDITREGAPAMLTFGGGIHYCLGANLARIELAEALSLMARRMPNIRRTGAAPWKPVTSISGPAALPVEFDLVR